jgi:hypothetical protein
VKVNTKRKTEINLELEETVVFRTRRTLIVWCQTCRRRAPMIAADEAAVVTGRSAREIYRLVEAGALHFIEDRHRLLFVCLTSLGQIALLPDA